MLKESLQTIVYLSPDTARTFNQALLGNSIKLLFYLSRSVKIQFFKSFILPYFDNGLSLLIYFPKAAIQRISNTFNNRLYILFKFRIEARERSEIESSDINNFNNYLFQQSGLISFQHCLLNKLLTFIHIIKNEESAPTTLKNNILNSEKYEQVPANFLKLRKNKEIEMKTETETKFLQQIFSKFFKDIPWM